MTSGSPTDARAAGGLSASDAVNIEDPGSLLGYLRTHGHIDAGEEPDIETLEGGVSNRTVLVTRSSGEAWVMKQALPKLRVAVDWFSDPIRVQREALGMRWLKELAPPGAIVDLVFEDHDLNILAMEAVPQPYENWKAMLLTGRVKHGHVVQFGTMLGRIHRASHERRGELASVFGDRSFFESLRLEPYYGYAGERVPEAAPFLGALIDETRSLRLALTHGDYSPKNILVHHDRLILLDHEVIHFGDPAFDVGFSLTHFLSKAHHIPDRREAFAEAATLHWTSYGDELGDVGWVEGLEERAVRHTLACLLARVDGRSPLEYLDEDERLRQRQLVLSLLEDAPGSIPTMTERFVGEL